MSFVSEMKKGFKRIYESEVLQNPRIRRTAWALVVFLTITLIVTIDFLPNAIKVKAGQVAKQDIKAPVTTTYVDKAKTEEMRARAAEQVTKVWKTDPAVSSDVQSDISSFFALVRKYQEEKGEAQEISDMAPSTPLSAEEKIQGIQRETDLDLSASEIRTLLQMEPEKVDQAEILLKKVTLNYLDKGIQQSFLESVKTNIAMELERSYFPAGISTVLGTIASQVIRPNIVLDREETLRRQEEAMAKVAPVERTVQEGEIIIRSGNVVSDEDVAILEALGLQRPQVNWQTILGLVLIVLITMSGVSYYLYQYHQKIYQDESTLVLIGLLAILILVTAKLLTFSQLTYVGYLVPLAAVSILVSILVDSMVAIVLTTALSFLTLIVTGGDLGVGGVLLTSGIAGIFSVSKVSQRSDLVRAGFYVSGAAALTIFAYSLTQSLSWIQVLTLTSWGIINGILVAIMANGLLPYLENVFGITSAVKLLELSNPNQPILKKLLMEAPGTYHHCILVGNLVEAAADRVGADSLLARTGAYYHDIGKIKRPYFFTDNQFGGENPHDKLSPGLSTLIIKSHVRDGVEMARKYKLPKPILDIIQQHHGTNLISFFYQEALKDEMYENVDESDFRYEGPKPQTKEAALIMLADITEAAVRSKQFNRSNHNRIEVLVKELIRKKLEEGQLDECDLTLRDLDEIAGAFTKVLSGIYHQRIEYPENIAKEMKMKGGQGVNGHSHK